MPVGNDVVDLRDPDNQPAAIHQRFDLRAFGETELDLLAATSGVETRHRLRWTLWAAKESALKYLRQIDPDLPFRPRDFTVSLAAPAGGRVAHREAELDLVLDVTPARIHAVAVDSAGDRAAAARRVAKIGDERPAPPGEASKEVRRLAAREVGRLLGLPAMAIEVRARARSAPRARHRGKVLPVDLSLSHDGAWIACAVVSVARPGG